jgi:hypothetical protein
MADGIAAEKLDFWAIPKSGPGPFFSLGPYLCQAGLFSH